MSGGPRPDHPWLHAKHRLALRLHRGQLRAEVTPGAETWLDAGHLVGANDAERLNICRGAAAQVGARGFNVYMGGRFAWLGGGSQAGWTPGVVAGLVAEGYGVFGSWVSLEPGQGGYDLGHQDGLDAVAAARSNYPTLRILSWDVEPSAWWANMAGVIDAMRGFHDAVHAAGYLDMPYGWEGTVANCPWADFVWVASPGFSDPARLRAPLADDFLAGRRSVQYGSLAFGGTDWDVSHSEFSLEDAMSLNPDVEPDRTVIANVQNIADAVGRWERDADTPGQQIGNMATAIPQILTKLDDIAASVKTGGVDVAALADALAPHLQQVDVAKLEADLEAALPAAVADQVKAAFAKALGT